MVRLHCVLLSRFLRISLLLRLVMVFSAVVLVMRWMLLGLLLARWICVRLRGRLLMRVCSRRL